MRERSDDCSIACAGEQMLFTSQRDLYYSNERPLKRAFHRRSQRASRRSHWKPSDGCNAFSGVAAHPVDTDRSRAPAAAPTAQRAETGEQSPHARHCSELMLAKETICVLRRL